jgi:uncharacterized protein (TIGR03437 family)
MHTPGRERWILVPLALILLTATSAFAAPANTPQIGGATCTASMVNGTYFYMLTGINALGGTAAPYAELGQLVANGSGGLSGQTSTNLSGQRGTYPMTGTYTVQPNCAGSMTLTVNSQTTTAFTFQVINNAQALVLAVSKTGEVVTGRAYRTTAASGGTQCSNGSLSGSYGYVFTGTTASNGASFSYSDSGQLAADGNGNLTGSSVTNLGGEFSNINRIGSYSVESTCLGTASISTQTSTYNFAIAIVQDGQQVLFLETDAGTTVSGLGQPQFVAPQLALVNAASFRPGMVAPGGLFSIFGTSLASQTAAAQNLPLPTTLGKAQVLVNGIPAPLVYVSGGQINAQMPVGIATGQPATFAVVNGTVSSNTVSLDLPAAAPGIFTTNGTQGIVQNPNGSLNSSTAPAHAGDVLVAYLTGGGAVNSPSWVTGAASPAAPARVTGSYGVTVGNESVDVQYVGLTPGFVGLYQANFVVPSLVPGVYPIVVTVDGNSSNPATVTVGD